MAVNPEDFSSDPRFRRIGLFRGFGNPLNKFGPLTLADEPSPRNTGETKAAIDRALKVMGEGPPQVAGAGSVGGFNSTGSFSAMTGMSGEVEQARLDMVERLKRVKANRAKSRISFPDIFPDQANITKDVGIDTASSSSPSSSSKSGSTSTRTSRKAGSTREELQTSLITRLKEIGFVLR